MFRPLITTYSNVGIDIDAMPVDTAMALLAGYDGCLVGCELLEQDDHDDTHDHGGYPEMDWTDASLAACGFRVVEPRTVRTAGLAVGQVRRGKSRDHHRRVPHKRALPGTAAPECVGSVATPSRKSRADRTQSPDEKGKAAGRSRPPRAGLEHLPGRGVAEPCSTLNPGSRRRRRRKKAARAG